MRGPRILPISLNNDLVVVCSRSSTIVEYGAFGLFNIYFSVSSQKLGFLYSLTNTSLHTFLSSPYISGYRIFLRTRSQSSSLSLK